VRACVIVPTFNHGPTLAAVITGAMKYGPVLVVDDGSTDKTAAVLAGIEGITVERHEKNRGKGAALRTGFDRAREMGFTHAVTIDADGQHSPDDIETLIDPDALVLGARDLVAAGAGAGSRFGLKNSNFWTWIETGLRLRDTQTGFRCYPLEPLQKLRLKENRYGFEIEVLVKAAWSGVEVKSVPVAVAYPEDRVSHMRPVLDFLRIARLNTKLVALRICVPAPYLELIVQNRFYEMGLGERFKVSLVELFAKEPGSNRRIALSVGLGLFMGLAPIWGFQIAATLIVAHVAGLSKPVAVVASHISVPVFIPAILYASLLLGRLALGSHHPGGGPITTLELQPADVAAWVIGSLILAGAASVAGALLTWVFLSCVRRSSR